MEQTVLAVSGLSVWDSLTGKLLVQDSSFEVKRGSCLAIIGESGSGKSVTCRAVMRLNRQALRQEGEIVLSGVNLSSLPEHELRKKRGKQMCMILQHGMRAFDPSCVVGVHLRETMAEHLGLGREETTARLKRAMEAVLLKDPLAVMNQYPHQLSGGMLQRIMIALALVLEPELIIADEPTTALDAIAQYEVLEQFVRLRERLDCSMLFVSHDLGAVRKVADELLVMRHGEIVERGDLQELMSGRRPVHPYTRELIDARQTLQRHFTQMMGGGS
ncbi:staphylopine uptake ABC transporter ATP-binding protein CntD [Paenibacillus sp. SYP-B4298]|uniref:staphylopine uptake ABC transporter ATP-binding protein CntD n=1 Tax=Paenibacillus sp. SYP-B4298 TaxID=2996034 RepID=UPI0022DE9480|nr:ABC transporter ATP-binding protein [Paenibacillus sp. SYP-B4298]